MNRWLVALGLVALVVVPAAVAFQCYECIPSKKEDCTDSDARKAVDCPGGEDAYCRKMEQNVLGTIQYVYQCGQAPGGKEKLFYNTANDYVKASVYHCVTDKCNDAAGLGVSRLASVVSVVALAWMLH